MFLLSRALWYDYFFQLLKLPLQLPAERSHESKNRNSLAQVAQVNASQPVMPDGSGRPMRLFLLGSWNFKKYQ